MLERRFQLLGLRDADAVAAHRACDSRVIEIVELGRKRTTAMQNPAQGVVVKHHVDDRNVGFKCGHQSVHGHRESTIAANRDDDAIGMHKLGRQRCWNRKAHRSRASSLQKTPRCTGLIEMRHQNAVFACIAGDDSVVR